MSEYADLWLRSATLVGVSYPERTVELVVMPYETGTLVAYDGRMCTETICRGAFDGIERRANRIRVNRDHNLERTVGRAVALYPSRDEGLVAEIRIAKTDLGEETLELAADGCLDASAGFRPMDGGLEWQGRDAYRITKAWLGHIAMTPDPAYEDAKVLAVRSASRAASPSSTPHLDQVRQWRLADRVASDPLYR
jgi:HK97 family phage prohead protease